MLGKLKKTHPVFCDSKKIIEIAPVPVALYYGIMPFVLPTVKSNTNELPPSTATQAAQAVTELPLPHGGGMIFPTEKDW